MRVLPWLAHFYTASGAVIAFLAIAAAAFSDYRTAFLWLYVAVVVDCTDGILARFADVKRNAPRVDGAHLDDIVDYTTYVFVPAFLMYQAALLPQWLDLATLALVLVASAWRFATADAKTEDYFFTGFPSYWNIVALYLYLWRLPPGVNATIVALLALLVFAPIRFIYPTRTTTLRSVTVAIGVVWGIALLWMVVRLPDRSPALVWASLAFPIYYTGLSVWLQSRS